MKEALLGLPRQSTSPDHSQGILQKSHCATDLIQEIYGDGGGGHERPSWSGEKRQTDRQNERAGCAGKELFKGCIFLKGTRVAFGEW